jgi:hypothetical protein
MEGAKWTPGENLIVGRLVRKSGQGNLIRVINAAGGERVNMEGGERGEGTLKIK